MPEPMRTEDFALQQCGVDEEAANTLMSMRLLCEVCSDPTQSNRVPAIAERCGFSERRVLQLLNSSEYRDILEYTARMKVAGYLSKGIMRLGRDVIENTEATAREISDAVKTLTGAYKALSVAAPSHERHQGAREAEKAIAEVLQNMKPAEVTYTTLETDARISN